MFGFLGDIGIGHHDAAVLRRVGDPARLALAVRADRCSTPTPAGPGSLAIVGLTITIRALLIPLFVKQIKSSRNMQLLQPQIKELQKKYGHDRERLTQEQMKLWKETGTNPFASCLPLMLQMPIFFALFRVIDQAASKGAEGAKGFLTGEQAESLSNATLLGAQDRRHVHQQRAPRDQDHRDGHGHRRCASPSSSRSGS